MRRIYKDLEHIRFVVIALSAYTIEQLSSCAEIKNEVEIVGGLMENNTMRDDVGWWATLLTSK